MGDFILKILGWTLKVVIYWTYSYLITMIVPFIVYILNSLHQSNAIDLVLLIAFFQIFKLLFSELRLFSLIGPFSIFYLFRLCLYKFYNDSDIFLNILYNGYVFCAIILFQFAMKIILLIILYFCLTFKSLGHIYLYYPYIFKALYANALFRITGELEFDAILDLCSSKYDQVHVRTENCYLTRQRSAGSGIESLNPLKFHLRLYRGDIMVKTIPMEGRMCREMNGILWSMERIIPECLIYFLRACFCTFLCTLFSYIFHIIFFYSYLASTSTGQTSSFNQTLSIFFVLELSTNLFQFYSSIRHFYFLVYSCISFYILHSNLVLSLFSEPQFSLYKLFFFYTLFWVVIISSCSRGFVLGLAFLSSKRFIYPSLVPDAYKMLISLALLRPISSCESDVLDGWYANPSGIELYYNADNPIYNYATIVLRDQLPDGGQTTGIYNTVEIFYFILCIVSEIKFFQKSKEKSKEKGE
ncbi:hypothetical protein F8M41_006677 [Gigaspora margarita]|uniref:Uncharacterized protein n=1 Tax=Gigaspora margarita TaxID=4874 RepID=A0A8H4AWM9_GIGMA|nr:hypothetical protein F8M41_006677 [Gigaspora margarita]